MICIIHILGLISWGLIVSISPQRPVTPWVWSCKHKPPWGPIPSRKHSLPMSLRQRAPGGVVLTRCCPQADQPPLKPGLTWPAPRSLAFDAQPPLPPRSLLLPWPPGHRLLVSLCLAHCLFWGFLAAHSALVNPTATSKGTLLLPGFQ